MRTKIKQLSLVAGTVILGVFFTFGVFTVNAGAKQVKQEQNVLSAQMQQNAVTGIYNVGDEAKCGEGKCGEGKCGEGKKAESKKKEGKKSEKKKESKKAEKKKTEKKKSESKCGEGKCG